MTLDPHYSRDRLIAYKAVEEAYRERAVRTLHEREEALAMPGVGPKTYRKWVREALESWRYARNTRRVCEREGWQAAVHYSVYGFKFRHQLKS